MYAYKIRRDEDYVAIPRRGSAAVVAAHADGAMHPVPSPARMMQDALADALAAAQPANGAANSSGWPMAARLMAIVGLSLALWGMIAAGILAII